MPASALAAVIGLCATTIGIQIRFFSVLKTDMRSLNGNIVNLGDHVERVEERLNRRIDHVEEGIGQRIELVSSDFTVVGRDVAHVKGQWDTMLTFLPYQKAESVTSLPS